MGEVSSVDRDEIEDLSFVQEFLETVSHWKNDAPIFTFFFSVMTTREYLSVDDDDEPVSFFVCLFVCLFVCFFHLFIYLFFFLLFVFDHVFFNPSHHLIVVFLHCY